MRFDRLNLMEQYILDNNTVSLDELSEHFGISLNTVRRDVKDLLKRDGIKKVYGGVAYFPSTPILPISERITRNLSAKEIIGRMAAHFVDDNSSIFLDSGTTTPHILQHLKNKKNITVITHSLTALAEAAKYPHIRTIALGGEYIHATSSYVGISTVEALERVRINSVFIAATGVSLSGGLTNSTYFEAEIKHNVAKLNSRVILMADHTKFDIWTVIKFFDFDDLYAVVTDKLPPPEYCKRMEEKNILLCCPETFKFE